MPLKKKANKAKKRTGWMSRGASIIGGVLGMLTEAGSQNLTKGGSQNLGQPKVW